MVISDTELSAQQDMGAAVLKVENQRSISTQNQMMLPILDWNLHNEPYCPSKAPFLGYSPKLIQNVKNGMRLKLVLEFRRQLIYVAMATTPLLVVNNQST